MFTKKYTILDEIGSGSYGNVYEVRSNITNIIYACKKIEITDDISYCLYGELAALRTFDHPNIIKVYDVMLCDEERKDEYSCYIIMDKCDTSLNDLLRVSKKNLTKNEILNYAQQIIDGLTYIHKRGYAHCDFSLANILLKGSQIKIIDFGFMYNRFIKQKRYHNTTSYVQPPELIKGKGTLCDPAKIDIWSFGQIFYAMCYNEPLIDWTDDNYYLDLITANGCPSTKIIEQFGLRGKYIKLYYRLILKKEYNGEIIFNDEFAFQLKELALRNKGENRHFNLKAKTAENRFIKKLMNWNIRKRPDIFEVSSLFQKLFYNINPKNLALNDNGTLTIYSLDNLFLHSANYIHLFCNNAFFRIHFNEAILKNKHYALNTKTMLTMSNIWLNYYKNRFACADLDPINCESNKASTPIGKIENNFDRYYSFTNIIYYQGNDFDEYVLSKSSIQIDSLAKLQYYFIILMNYNVNNQDAMDFFVEKKASKFYRPYYRFLYYIFLSSPYSISVRNEYVFTGLMIIILAYFHKSINKVVRNQFTKINSIIQDPDNAGSKFLNNNMNKSIAIKLKTPFFNLIHITADSFIIAYYLLWIVKKLPKIDIKNAATSLAVENKFPDFILNLN